MRPRAKWIAIGLIVSVVVLALSIRKTDGGPQYHGRSLSDWVNSFGDNLDPDAPMPDSEARVAVVNLLSNNLPWAIHALEYDPNPRRLREVAQYRKMPGFLRRNGWGVRFFGQDREAEQSIIVIIAFDIAGPRAEFAVPDLTNLMHSTNQVCALNAVHVLSRIGPAAQGPLEMVFTNSSYPFRAQAAHVLVPRGVTGCEHLLPLLYASPDPRVREAATNTMRRWGLHADPLSSDPAPDRSE